MQEVDKKAKKMFEGVVVSDKMNKTIVVKTTRTVTHPVFKKVLRISKKYKVHDEKNSAKTGDRVEFHEVRPLSKTKYMMLSRVISSLS